MYVIIACLNSVKSVVPCYTLHTVTTRGISRNIEEGVYRKRSIYAYLLLLL